MISKKKPAKKVAKKTPASQVSAGQEPRVIPAVVADHIDKELSELENRRARDLAEEREAPGLLTQSPGQCDEEIVKHSRRIKELRDELVETQASLRIWVCIRDQALVIRDHKIAEKSRGTRALSDEALRSE